jgi:hypothetical protein
MPSSIGSGENNTVTAPPHYRKHPSGVECIEVTEWMGFNLGNAIKYIWRADFKGSRETDLRKAIWYLERELAKTVSKAAPAEHPILDSSPYDKYRIPKA